MSLTTAKIESVYGKAMAALAAREGHRGATPNDLGGVSGRTQSVIDERRASIIHQLRTHGPMRAGQLRAAVGASTDALNCDYQALSKSGQVTRRDGFWQIPVMFNSKRGPAQ